MVQGHGQEHGRGEKESATQICPALIDIALGQHRTGEQHHQDEHGLDGTQHPRPQIVEFRFRVHTQAFQAGCCSHVEEGGSAFEGAGFHVQQDLRGRLTGARPGPAIVGALVALVAWPHLLEAALIQVRQLKKNGPVGLSLLTGGEALGRDLQAAQVPFQVQENGNLTGIDLGRVGQAGVAAVKDRVASARLRVKVSW